MPVIFAFLRLAFLIFIAGVGQTLLENGRHVDALPYLLRIEETSVLDPAELASSIRACYVQIDDPESALPFAELAAVLEQRQSPRSLEHAFALINLANVLCDLRNVDMDMRVLKVLSGSLKIMEELGFFEYEYYTTVRLLFACSKTLYFQRCFRERLPK